MALSTAQQDIIAHRRERVAYYRWRRFSERAVVAALAAEGCLNPEDSTPWSAATIHSDVAANRKADRAEAGRQTAQLRADLLGEIRELRRVAWLGEVSEGGPVVAALTKALQDEDVGVRKEAAKALGALVVGRDTATISDTYRQERALLGLDGAAQLDLTTGGQPFSPVIHEVLVQIIQPQGEAR